MKDPKDMTENEKIIWKVEIFKQSEDMDDMIDEKIRQIQQERSKLTNMADGNDDMIKVYKEAVDRIARVQRQELKKSNSDSNLKKEEEKKVVSSRRTVPKI